MPKSGIFTRTCWAVAVAAAFGVAGMLLYPGGTALDRTSQGYSLSRNFFSDLGSTVAYGGQPNQGGALLFVASLVTLIAGFAGFLVGVQRLFVGAARSWARLAVAVGVLVCVAFSGVSLTPENQFWIAHVQFTLWAFRVFPAVPLLLALATLYDERFPRHAAIVWLLLTAVLCGYVVVLEWGPQAHTDRGLLIQVVAQKLVTTAAVLAVMFQSYQAGRIRPPSGEERPNKRIWTPPGGRESDQ